MTRDKAFKAAVRERKAKTGESYAAARSHMVREGDLEAENAKPAADSQAALGDLAAASENAAPRCAACDDCASKRDLVGPGGQSWEEIEELRSPADLTTFPGLTPRTTSQHIGERDGILARYEFDREVRCSLAGAHLHRKGIVVRTLCELTLCMGFDCGRKSIIGFEDIVENLRRRERFRVDARYVESWTNRYREGIARLSPLLMHRIHLDELLRRSLPDLHAELRRRHRQRSGVATRVLVDSKIERHLAGIAIVEAPKRHPDALTAVLASFERQEAERPPVDGPSAAELKRIAKSGTDRLVEFTAWIRETTPFTTKENILLALLAAGLKDPEVWAEGGDWRVTHFGSWPGVLIGVLYDLD